jgi:hypothetical protein
MKPLISALALCCLASWAFAASGTEAAAYYQVTFTDGRVEDLPGPPGVREGIHRVTRITRSVDAGRGSVVLSTGPRPIQSSLPSLSRTDLTWDGRAWVVPAPESPPRDESPDQWAQLAIALDALYQLEKLHARRLAETQQDAPTTRESPEAGATDQTTETRRILARVRALIARHERGLTQRFEAPEGIADPSGQPARSLETQQPGEPHSQPHTGEMRVLPHQVQVWPLPESAGQRTYRVSLPHAEAGALGAFCYVAYADSDDDGTPDRLIARSPLVSAERPGERTDWSFHTDEPRVFVGNAWLRTDAAQWIQAPAKSGRDDDWGLPDEVYVSGFFGKVPRRREASRPYVHGLRVRLKPRERPDQGESEIIRRVRPKTAPR